ncbi:adenosine receptor A3-like [Oculina patagonica]
MNRSSTSSEEGEWRPVTSDHEIILWCTIYILTAIAILCANIFAIYVFTTKRLLRKRSNILLMNLATADLMIGGIAVPMFVCIFYKTLRDYQWQGKIVNEVYIAVDIFAGLSSMTILAVIALERAYSVFLPLKHRCTSRRSRFYWLSAAFAWTMAGILTSLKILTVRGTIPLSYDNHIIFAFVSIALTTIMVAYVSIWTRIRSRKKNTSYVIREKSVVHAMLTVTIFFIVMWLPFFLINVIGSFNDQLLLAVPPNVIYAAKLMHYGNSIVNPIIYSFKLPHFRKALRKVSYRSSVRTDLNV